MDFFFDGLEVEAMMNPSVCNVGKSLLPGLLRNEDANSFTKHEIA